MKCPRCGEEMRLWHPAQGICQNCDYMTDEEPCKNKECERLEECNLAWEDACNRWGMPCEVVRTCERLILFEPKS